MRPWPAQAMTSYLDVCNGQGDQRRALIEKRAVVGGLAVVAAAAWVTWVVVEDRNRLT